MASERIKVVIRSRPSKENNENSIQWRNNTLFIQSNGKESAASFRCEHFMDLNRSQEETFQLSGVKSLVESAVNGFSSTIFAYGQTGAGKSFTIFGPDHAFIAESNLTDSMQGILPRSIAYLMQLVHANSNSKFKLRVGCIDIYNDQIHDLVATKAQYALNTPLSIRWNKEQGFYLEQACIVDCSGYDDIMRVILLAASNRICSSHNLNDRSNRSHCLVSIYISSEDFDGTNCKYGKLTIVDLAGSERAQETGAVGMQLKESGHINKSLYCLSQVILALNSNKKDRFVPYRDSKLTTLLIDSLGGTSRTLMLACVNSSQQFSRESIRTLEFAMGVARIQNRPVALLSPQDQLVSDLKQQIKMLQKENAALRMQSTDPEIQLHLPSSHGVETIPKLSITQEESIPFLSHSAAFYDGQSTPFQRDQLGAVPQRLDPRDAQSISSAISCTKTPHVDALPFLNRLAAFHDGSSTPLQSKKSPPKIKTKKKSKATRVSTNNPYVNPKPTSKKKRSRPPHQSQSLPALHMSSMELQRSYEPLSPLLNALPSLLNPIDSNQSEKNLLLGKIHNNSTNNSLLPHIRLEPVIPLPQNDSWDDQRAHDLFLQLCNI